MPINFADEATKTGETFQTVADAIEKFLHDNPLLDPEVRNQLDGFQGDLLANADKFFHLSDTITFGTDQQLFSKVDEATKAINANLQTLQTTDKWLAFAGAVVSLGASILSGNNAGILPAAQTILSTFNIKSPVAGKS